MNPITTRPTPATTLTPPATGPAIVTHTRTSTLVGGVLLGAGLLVLLFTTTGCRPTETVPGTGSNTSAVRVATLQEDDPGWDCRTMGNRVCGFDPDALLDTSSVRDRVNGGAR